MFIRVRTLLLLLIILAYGAATPTLRASQAEVKLVDSQTFLTHNSSYGPQITPAMSSAVERLLAGMTLREKIGQMTQLEVGMITDGIGPNIRINQQKLHKAIG